MTSQSREIDTCENNNLDESDGVTLLEFWSVLSSRFAPIELQ